MDLENYTNVNIFKRHYEKKEVMHQGNMIEQPHHHLAGGTVEHAFNPYQNNEGTVIAIAGQDFVMAAADTRISNGYSILSRKHSKTTKLTSKVVITSAGMVADVETLHKNLLFDVKMYKMQNKGREPSVEALASKLSNFLYGRRFMPYYAFNLLCGLDKDGKGAVFGYDAVGSYDKLTYGVQGSGNSLGAPILDNQFVGHNFLVKVLPTDLAETENTAKDIINSIAERDIYTGDGVEIVTVTKDGVTVKREAVRRD